MGDRGRRGWLWVLLSCGVLAVCGVVLWLLTPSLWVQAEAPLGATVVGLAAVAAVVTLAVMVSARRRAARSAAQAARVDEQATAARRRFLSRLDHELKNPVTVVRTLAAQHEGETDWDAAASQAGRMSRLVGDLRGLAELEVAPLEVTRVEPDRLVREALEDLEQEAIGEELRHRAVQVHLPSAPWPLPACTGDPDLLRLAISNLISNAVKYSSEGDRVEVRGTEADGWVVIEVADTGRGIPEQEVGLVLEELGRASNALDRPGSGVGLAMVRVIAARHGGAVLVRSRLGEGTSVRLTLPVTA